jgi:hypothetical protein
LISAEWYLEEEFEDNARAIMWRRRKRLMKTRNGDDVASDSDDEKENE